MVRDRLLVWVAVLCVGVVSIGARKPKAAPPPDPFREATQGLERHEGLLAVYPDPDGGRVLLELPAPEKDSAGRVLELLYVEGIATGLGSNPVGLDRGQLGESAVLVIRRLGNRVLFEQPNYAFRALTDDPEELRATAESFAPSVLWATETAAIADDGRSVIDLAPFLVRDAHGISGQMKRSGHGGYALDRERSAIDPAATLVFPDNLEFEALLTYATGEPGDEVSRTAPSGDSFALVQHHSLIRLPDDGYRPRELDPRAGSFGISFQDYAAPLDAPIERRWIVRHRLRATPGSAPELVYYVDRGIPEPVRSAVMEGAGWWAKAFDAAGFPGAYRVELLPEGVHPLDVRYNVIQWVHRSTRGWSYGGGVVDPRTGEMLKGHVNLGSLRVRQDRLIFEGLLGTAASGTGSADDPVELALARVRQLAAHEVGHTLGLAHNFAASTYGRESVMDYPAPLVTVDADGEIDASRAYGVGVGAWDVHAIRWAYSEYPDAEAERAGLAALTADALARGLVMLTDRDARPASAAQPLASLWDNGDDAVEQLEREMEVRRVALARFGPRNVRDGQPLALLEEVLATVYFHHRYQVEAAVKVLGGVDYRYALRGDGQGPATPIDGAWQRRALEVLLDAADPAVLDLPEDVIRTILPRPLGYSGNREQMAGATWPTFDPLAAAETAADLVLRGILEPGRCARLVDHHRRDAELPGLEEVLQTVIGRVFGGEERGGRLQEIARAVQRVTVERLIALAAGPDTAPAVVARAEGALEALREMLLDRWTDDVTDGYHMAFLVRSIERHLNRPAPAREPGEPALAEPPGSPIGSMPELDGCSFQPFLEAGGR